MFLAGFFLFSKMWRQKGKADRWLKRRSQEEVDEEKSSHSESAKSLMKKGSAQPEKRAKIRY